MENNTAAVKETTATPLITSQELLHHWQGHRSLTRRVIEAFPEDQLFTFSVGGMRPFGLMAVELLDLATVGVHGAATGNWKGIHEMDHAAGAAPQTKAELLARWDQATELINTYWAQITPQRFRETDRAFGAYEGTIYSIILYWLDNENHHRGQGYVYLRALGIEPPPFWDRP